MNVLFSKFKLCESTKTFQAAIYKRVCTSRGEMNLASQVNLTYLNRFKADIIMTFIPIMYEMTM